MAETSAKKVADYIVAFSHEHGNPITNLKLQKLLYYAQAWYLALKGVPLFDERIEAWVHGPVVPDVYRSYKGWAWQTIQDNPDIEALGLSDAVRTHVDDVLDAYGSLSAYELEKLTHSETPWKNARRGIASDESSSALISHEVMRDHYRLATMSGDSI